MSVTRFVASHERGPREFVERAVERGVQFFALPDY